MKKSSSVIKQVFSSHEMFKGENQKEVKCCFSCYNISTNEIVTLCRLNIQSISCGYDNNIFSTRSECSFQLKKIYFKRTKYFTLKCC